MSKQFIQVHENDPAYLVVMHEPAIEVTLGSLHPFGSLYECGGSTQESINQHQNMVNVIRDFGIDVRLVREILKERHDRIKATAYEALKYAFVDDTASLKEEEMCFLNAEYKNNTLSKMSIDDLLHVILTRPTIELQKTQHNTHLGIKSIRLDPVGNLVFTRDQQVVTAKGLVLANLNSNQRTLETIIMKHVWESLGVPIVGRIKEPGKLEGGDFLAAGYDLSFIGVGLRTNMIAVQQMFDENLFGTKKVAVVVDDKDLNQERMHLDTFFNILDEKTAVILEDVAGEDKEKRRVVHEYVKNESGKYVKSEETEFLAYLKKNGYKVITVTDQQQKEYMINFLNLGRGRIISVHPDLEKVLKENGWKGDIKYVPYRGVTRLYGAAHCSTQVFRLPSSTNQ